MSSFLKGATETPLKNEKRKKLTSCFPIPSSDAAHPQKLDKAIAAILPKTAFTYDWFLSKPQQFSMDSLGPLITVLSQVRKGKCTLKDMIPPLEAAISLTGNAAAHLSVERRKALMKHLNKDLKPLAEGDFPHHGPLLFGESFASKAKSTVDNVKALMGFMTKKPQKGLPEAATKQKEAILPASGSPHVLRQPALFPRATILNFQPPCATPPPSAAKPETSTTKQ